MKMVDVRCPSCGIETEKLERDSEPMEPCVCGAAFERALLDHPEPKANGVHGDDIPGGLVIKHGICNEDGTPKTYYTRHEIRDALKKAGLVSMEESGQQVPVYDQETEDNFKKRGHEQATRITSTPATLSPEDEAKRVAHWHRTEAKLHTEKSQ